MCGFWCYSFQTGFNSGTLGHIDSCVASIRQYIVLGPKYQIQPLIVASITVLRDKVSETWIIMLGSSLDFILLLDPTIPFPGSSQPFL